MRMKRRIDNTDLFHPTVERYVTGRARKSMAELFSKNLQCLGRSLVDDLDELEKGYLKFLKKWSAVVIVRWDRRKKRAVKRRQSSAVAPFALPADAPQVAKDIRQALFALRRARWANENCNKRTLFICAREIGSCEERAYLRTFEPTARLGLKNIESRNKANKKRKKDTRNAEICRQFAALKQQANGKRIMEIQTHLAKEYDMTIRTIQRILRASTTPNN